jgi:pimeloyl-ACP methyl ester carboxylesterase
LSLPLIHEEPSAATVEIALIKLPASIDDRVDKPPAAPLLVNPGGPGGSGVQFVKSVGHDIREIIGHGRDIIGFDPRGIGYSYPSIDCFDTGSASDGAARSGASNFHRMTWSLTKLHAGLINTDSDDALRNHFARNAAISDLCLSKDNVTGPLGILRHAGTTNVAKDMLGILTAVNKWERIGTGMVKNNGSGLVYWGFSYGSLLGMIFAALFPDRVERIIVDGVLHAENYMGSSWFSSIRNSDAVLASFSRYCREAEIKCSIYRSGDTEKAVHDRMKHMVHRLEKEPIALLDSSTGLPTILSSAHLKRMLFYALFNPIKSFPRVAEWLDILDRGDHSEIAKIVPLPATSGVYGQYCGIQASPPVLDGEQGRAVSCSDSRLAVRISNLPRRLAFIELISGQFNATIPELRRIFQSQKDVHYFADVWLENILGCNKWNISGSAEPLPFPPAEQIRTSYPLLFITNSLDPVGPAE